MTDLHSAKEYEIESDNDVGLAFIRAKVNAYLSITARAEVRRDHVTAAEIWKPTDNMWTAGTRFSPSRLLQRLTLRIGCWKNH